MIMDTAYGIHGDAADPYISTAIEAVNAVTTATAPGAFLVDFLPFREHYILRKGQYVHRPCSVKHIPEWVPGAGFQRKARHWNILRHHMTEKPFQAAKHQIVRAKAILTRIVLNVLYIGHGRIYTIPYLNGLGKYGFDA